MRVHLLVIIIPSSIYKSTDVMKKFDVIVLFHLSFFQQEFHLENVYKHIVGKRRSEI